MAKGRSETIAPSVEAVSILVAAKDAFKVIFGNFFAQGLGQGAPELEANVADIVIVVPGGFGNLGVSFAVPGGSDDDFLEIGQGFGGEGLVKDLEGIFY
jgi:hypothetical protein